MDNEDEEEDEEEEDEEEDEVKEEAVVPIAPVHLSCMPTCVQTHNFHPKEILYITVLYFLV